MGPDQLRLTIERLGRRGEGVALEQGEPIYVPYTLPGETVLADRDGERAHVIEFLSTRADRVPPICPYYGTCGGCAIQTLPVPEYAAWKRGLLVTALARAGLDVAVEALVDAHGVGRRRATFHARLDESRSPPRVGFMQARAHRIVDLEVCPILAPAMDGALTAARGIAAMLSSSGKPLDLLVTATDAGLDLDFRGLGKADEAQQRAVVAAAGRLGLARLSNHGEILIERQSPVLRMGSTMLTLPPGAFLQATVAGEEALASRVLAAVGAARKVADLFCGVGTFALRLASGRAVEAYDMEPRAIAALTRAAQGTSGLRQPRAQTRDLFQRPLTAAELAGFDAVVFDPPRAGALAQSAELAKSNVATVVAVACDPGTFARDAATLVAGGYGLESVVPIDQFRYASHVEIVAVFRKRSAPVKRRRLLS